MTLNAYLVDAIVSATANDYESVDLIWEQVSRWANRDGQLLSRESLEDGLLEMAQSGKLECYLYSKAKGAFEKAECRREQLPDLWFMARGSRN